MGPTCRGLGFRILVAAAILNLVPAISAASASASLLKLPRAYEQRKVPWPERYVVANEYPSPAGTPPRGFANRGESFEIYSDPIELGYGEVHFRFQPPKPLPRAVVERFSGKYMAVTGYEVQRRGNTPTTSTQNYSNTVQRHKICACVCV